MRRALTAVAVFGAAAVSFGFLLLPIVALFTHQSLRELLHQLSNPVVTDALVVSVKTSAVAQAALVFGEKTTPAARAAIRLWGPPAASLPAPRRFPGRAFVITLVELPL